MTTAHEPEAFPQQGSSGSCTTPCYSVQARYTYMEPKEVGGVIYHKDWRTVPFEKSQVGVPNNTHSDAANNLGLLSYQSAQALRWWFHASLGYGDLCFETRILKHVVKHSYSEEIVGAFDHVGGENRSNLMPDWNNGEKK